VQVIGLAIELLQRHLEIHAYRAADCSKRLRWAALNTFAPPLGYKHQVGVQQIDSMTSLADFQLD
jgi:hypothetical protein